MNTETGTDPIQATPGRKRTRIVRPYPINALQDALVIASTIQDVNAGLELDRTLLARAMGTTPASSGFTMRLNSSAKYGLTQGGYNDPRISLTQRGESIVSPRDDEEKQQALIKAAMQPEVFQQFYRMLDGKRLPEDTYARNMIQRELGIHSELTDECLTIIKANGLYTGVLTTLDDGALRVDLERGSTPTESRTDDVAGIPGPSVTAPQGSGAVERPTSKIFIGHDGSPEDIRLVSGVLDEVGIPYGSVQEVSGEPQPVSSQVSEEMRACTAAVLVFANRGPGEEDARRSAERMLYQLGASSVLYGDRIVILKEDGFELAYELGTLRMVVFDRERPEQAGLALLGELHRAGVIRIVG
jgi:hypothetical protein